MGMVKHFESYLGAISLAVVLVLAWYLAQLPFSVWLPGFALLPEWLHDRTLVMLVATYYVYIVLPAFIVGTIIFYFKVVKNL